MDASCGSSGTASNMEDSWSAGREDWMESFLEKRSNSGVLNYDIRYSTMSRLSSDP